MLTFAKFCGILLVAVVLLCCGVTINIRLAVIRQQDMLDNWNTTRELSAKDLDEMDVSIRRLIRDNTAGSDGPLKIKGNLTRLMQGGRGQPLVIDALLGRRRDGFYVEAGAADGQLLSNSLLFEVKRNWTGLLVEANPEYYSQLLETNRRAITINCCLGTSRAPQRLEFLLAGAQGRIRGAKSKSSGIPIGSTRQIVDCFPLAAILRAINRTKIDFLVLDLEGAEVPVLSLIPFDQLDVGIVMAEVSHIGALVKGIRIKMMFQMLDRAGFDFLGMVFEDVIFGNRKWDLKVGRHGRKASTFSAVTDSIQRSLHLPPNHGDHRHKVERLWKRMRERGEIGS